MSRTCGEHRKKYYVTFFDDDNNEIIKEEYFTQSQAKNRLNSYKGKYNIKITKNMYPNE